MTDIPQLGHLTLWLDGRVPDTVANQSDLDDVRRIINNLVDTLNSTIQMLYAVRGLIDNHSDSIRGLTGVVGSLNTSVEDLAADHASYFDDIAEALTNHNIRLAQLETMQGPIR